MADSDKSDPASDGAQDAQSVGQALRKARAAQDLSLEQLAAELRIEAKQLTALEQDQFSKIGVPVFVKGYLRQYGTRLGLDPADLLAIYYRQGKLADVDIRPSRPIKLRDEQQITVWIVAAVVLLLIGGALAVWWLNGASGFAPSNTPPPADQLEDNGPDSTPEPVAAQRVEPAAPGNALPDTPPAANTAAAGGSLAGAPRADDSLASPPSLVAAPVAAPEPEPEREPEPEPPSAQPSPEDGGAPPQPLRPLGDYVADLDLTFGAESWVEITDARGERLLFGLAEAGRHAVLRGEPPFSVLLGDASEVRLLVDGAEYEIPMSRQGNLARFTLRVTED